MQQVNEIIKIARYLNTSEESKGNYIIIQKILNNVNEALEVMENNDGFIYIKRKCEYILENKENKFTFELKNHYINEIASIVYEIEENMHQESQSAVDNLAQLLNMNTVDLRKG